MISGIFFCASSLIAICKGSVSPSAGTSIGAFMLMIHCHVPLVASGRSGTQCQWANQARSRTVERTLSAVPWFPRLSHARI